MTDKEIARLQEICKWATDGDVWESSGASGKWYVYIGSNENDYEEITVKTSVEDREITIAYVDTNCEDAEFIAEARTALPELLSAYQELSRENAAYKLNCETKQHKLDLAYMSIEILKRDKAAYRKAICDFNGATSPAYDFLCCECCIHVNNDDSDAPCLTCKWWSSGGDNDDFEFDASRFNDCEDE